MWIQCDTKITHLVVEIMSCLRWKDHGMEDARAKVLYKLHSLTIHTPSCLGNVPPFLHHHWIKKVLKSAALLEGRPHMKCKSREGAPHLLKGSGGWAINSGLATDAQNQ